MRPIDADALHEIRFTDIFNENVRHSKSKLYMLGWNDAIDAIIYDTPTVNAVPVRHGRWVERWVDNKHRIGDMECSVCGAPMLDCPSYSLYCPWCGARMDKNETD